MNNMDQRFATLRKEGKGALIAYFPLGEPRIDPLEMAKMYFDNGVDILEIGFPVADPFLDGRVVADSMARILGSGFEVEWFFEQINEIHNKIPGISLEIFGYAQLFDKVNRESFCRYCRQSKTDAVLIADADKQLQRSLDAELPQNIYNLRFMPYDFTEENILDAAANAEGYLLYQAVTGATGAREKLDKGLEEKVRCLKSKIYNVPICPGFGISTPKHCAEIMKMGADGVIIGSLVVDSIIKDGLGKTGQLLRTMKNSLITKAYT